MYKNIKIATVTATRGDRPEFFRHSMKMLARETVQPDIIEIVDYKPIDDKEDLLWRTRLGCERAFAKGADVVFFWEDDDWFAPDFIEKMVDKWIECGKPVIFGGDITIYYHIVKKIWGRIPTPQHASGQYTLITKKCVEETWSFPTKFGDWHLWQKYGGKPVTMDKQLVISIKHGYGMCAGTDHHQSSAMPNNDPDMTELAGRIDAESLKFYREMSAWITEGCKKFVPTWYRPTMRAKTIDLVVAINDNGVYNAHTKSSHIPGNVIVHEMRGYTKVIDAYTEAFKECNGDIMMFCHQDVRFPFEWWDRLWVQLGFLRNTNWGVLGVAGWKGGQPVGHVWSVDMLFGSPIQSPAEVDNIDEMCLILKKGTVLRFDSALPGNHCYGRDLCYQAKANGLGCFIIGNFCYHKAPEYEWVWGKEATSPYETQEYKNCNSYVTAKKYSKI